MRTMTKFEFRRALEQLDLTQGTAAQFLGVSIRSTHGWANGDKIPIPVQKLLRVLVNAKITAKAAETPIPAE